MPRETIIGSREPYSSTECGATTLYGSCSCPVSAHRTSTTLAQEQELAQLEEDSRTDTRRTGARTYWEVSILEATPTRLETVAAAGYQFSISWTTTSAIPTSPRHLLAGGFSVREATWEADPATLPSPEA